jgi:kynurenine formamidase
MKARRILMPVALVGVCFGLLLLGSTLTRPEPATAALPGTPPSLDDLFHGKVHLLDLTYSINEKTPHWPGANYEPFRLTTLATLEHDGVLSKAFSMPEHLGTHLDAPNHFEANQPSVDQIPLERFFAPGVVLSIAQRAAEAPDTELTVEDIERWEQVYGPVPEDSVFLLHTGWARYWNDYDRYKNADDAGRLHFPGYSAEAARYLVQRRKVRGIGIDNLSMDRGLSQDFAVHHIVCGAGRYGLENVANLDQLPPTGFYVIVAPIKIETGTGGPTRVIALLPN